MAEHGPELDQYIAQYAKNWNFARIPLPAAAIMRVAMYEILYRPDIPAAASINDAVEIAKKYEDEKIVSFINGILGALCPGRVSGYAGQTRTRGGLTMGCVLGLDTSNYTTSAAWFDGETGEKRRQASGGSPGLSGAAPK